MFKRALALLITIVSAFTLLCTVASADDDGITYLYTHKCSSDLSITSLYATCTSSLTGYVGTTTRIELKQTLEETFGGISWYYVDSWSTAVNFFTIDFVNTKSPLSSGNYRIKNVAKVYSGSNYETITFYSDVVSS